MNRNQLATLFSKQLSVPGMKDALREPLYDHLTYNSGSTTQLVFFAQQVGGSVTYADTNMQLAGMLPKGWKFVSEAISIDVLPGSNASSYVRQDPVKSGTALAAPNFANDVWALLSVGWLQVVVNQKPFLTAPLLDFPSFTGLHISSALAVENTNTTVLNQLTADYARVSGRPFGLSPVLPIEENTGFTVTLNWPSAVTLPSGFDARIGVHLHGVKFRAG